MKDLMEKISLAFVLCITGTAPHIFGIQMDNTEAACVVVYDKYDELEIKLKVD